MHENKHTTATYQARHFATLVEYAMERGADVRRVAAALDFDLAALNEPGKELPITLIEEYCDLLGKNISDPFFAMRLGMAIGWSRLGRLVRSLDNSKTVLEVLRRLEDDVFKHRPPGMITVSIENDVVCAGYDFAASETGYFHNRNLVESALFQMAIELRRVLGRDWQPIATHFRHERSIRTVPVDIAWANIAFGQDRNAVCFDAKYLDHPWIGGDRQAHDNALPLAEPARVQMSEIENQLRRLLAEQNLSLPILADHFHISERQLQRNLKALGTSYSGLLRKVRRQLSLNYLVETRLPFNEIGPLLGIADLAGFSRFVRTEFGVPPSKIRQNPEEFTEN